ncbi:MAG: Asp-tRNA(Asn)/Glu-tRNA(Gln) amidotransferase subunit GatB [Ignavibacteria bacterium]|nr:Asp-tRNA(Asn)/Glu-tRNA(Gln) amidotransferase subunit GatB [Ignavibacteria bacterium]
MKSDYEAVIGLEVHVQLKTQTKAFCGCSTSFASSPNMNTCPICLGHPGALPVLNKNIVEYALLLGLATGCSIRPYSVFSRKNYFYPDLPKGYQVSQYEDPICFNGEIEIESENTKKRIGITRIHMEEDAGKSIHDIDIDTLVDLNRSGVPLLEIVSEPDIRSGQEAYQYLMQIRQIVMYLGVCDGNMEEGSLRCDANISVRKRGAEKFGTRTEVKNLNSFRNVERAIGYEIERQVELIESGGYVVQQSMQWDASIHETKVMRSKEKAHDYRYFPEPDLVGVNVNEEWLRKVQLMLPELPQARKARFIYDFGLPAYDAGILIEEKSLGDYFENVVSKLAVKSKDRYKLVSNWIMTEVMRVLSERKIAAAEFVVEPAFIAEIVDLISSETISNKTAKEVFAEMLISNKAPKSIVNEKGLSQVSDVIFIESTINSILKENVENVEKYRSGKNNLFGYFVSQVLKNTGGKANPKIVTEVLKRMLEN